MDMCSIVWLYPLTLPGIWRVVYDRVPRYLQHSTFAWWSPPVVRIVPIVRPHGNGMASPHCVKSGVVSCELVACQEFLSGISTWLNCRKQCGQKVNYYPNDQDYHKRKTSLSVRACLVQNAPNIKTKQNLKIESSTVQLLAHLGSSYKPVHTLCQWTWFDGKYPIDR